MSLVLVWWSVVRGPEFFAGAGVRYGLLERLRRAAGDRGVEVVAFGMGREEVRLMLRGEAEAVLNTVRGVKVGTIRAVESAGGVIKFGETQREVVADVEEAVAWCHRLPIDEGAPGPLASAWSSHRDLLGWRRAMFFDPGLESPRKGSLMRVPIVLLAAVACRVEMGTPGGDVAATVGAPTGEVWVYTSMYQSVLDALEPRIEEALAGVDVRFYQAGSEKVAQRVEAEWEAGGSPACLLMTSDPFWYVDLKERGRLVPHFAPTILHVDRSLVDRDGYWATSRVSLMVLAVHGGQVPEDARPDSFAALADPRFRDRFGVPDPLASGTAFTTVAFWLEDGGWERIAALDANGMIAAGGNSSVLTRIETAERPVGALLLENVLPAVRKGSPAVAVFPSDGAIVVPGPIGLTSGCPNPTAAKAVYDFVPS